MHQMIINPQAIRTLATAQPWRFWIVVGGLFALVIFLGIRKWRSAKHQLPLPPSPPGNLLLGNLAEVMGAVAKKQQHLLFEKWARQYGEIYRVRNGPFVQYFVNSDMAVKEIFDRNSAFTSGRPRWITSNEQICGELNVLLLQPDARWKQQRKAAHNYLTSVPRADAGLPYMEYESAKFLHDVAHSRAADVSGWRLFRSILRYTYSTFTSQVFGMDIREDDNQVIADIHETGLAQILATLPGSNIVDMIPVLDKLPLMFKPWEQRNRQRFERDMRFVLDKLRRVTALREKGYDTPQSFLPMIEAADDSSQFGAGLDEAAYLSLMLVMGAADTSTVSTWSFMEAMMLFPDVQEKAREEIVKVVGDRMPVYEDLEKIPYVRCLMKETWRWRPPVALGHPHVTTKELVYGGYRIPKGAHLHLNGFAIQHDPQRHHDPERFIPERFENDHTNSMQSINSKDVSSRDHFAFGAGRRVCPGYHVAERSLALSIMRILWAFNIVPSDDAILPLDPSLFEGEMMPGAPDKRMPVTLTVISEKRREHIDEAFKAATASRPELEPLVDLKTGQGAFEPLSFANFGGH